MKTIFKTILGVLLMCFIALSAQATRVNVSVTNVKQKGMLLIYKDTNGESKRKDFELVDGKASVRVSDPIEKYTLFTLVLKGFTSKSPVGYVHSTVVTFYGSDNTDLTIHVKGVNDYAPRMRDWNGYKRPDFDYLGYFIRKGHQLGLQIHASLNVFVGGHNFFTYRFISLTNESLSRVNCS